MKRIVRLTETDLHRIIKESVKRVLREDKYETPNGGFDSYAYEYDDALEKANSLEDWDRMMADREEWSRRRSKNGLGYHPQTDNKFFPGGVGASRYVRPKTYGSTEDSILDDLEYGAGASKKMHGFSF